jgi:hypothetical protein
LHPRMVTQLRHSGWTLLGGTVKGLADRFAPILCGLWKDGLLRLAAVEVNHMAEYNAPSIYEVIEIAAADPASADEPERRRVGTFPTYEAACNRKYDLEQDALKSGRKCRYRIVERLRFRPWV